MKFGKRQGQDRPGSRIPFHERVAADLWIRAHSSLASPEQILAEFRQEAERAIELTRGLSPDLGARCVRIGRFPGLESACRQWSAYMTLDHLVMVNTAITTLMHAICTGHNHGVEISVEDINPHDDAGPDRIKALQSLIDRYSHLIGCMGTLRSHERHPHPWFGPLTARQWHALAALHNRTHRIQIEKIVSRLD